MVLALKSAPRKRAAQMLLFYGYCGHAMGQGRLDCKFIISSRICLETKVVLYQVLVFGSWFSRFKLSLKLIAFYIGAIYTQHQSPLTR